MDKIKKVLYKFEMEAIILRSLLSWCDPPPPRTPPTHPPAPDGQSAARMSGSDSSHQEVAKLKIPSHQ